MTTLWKPNSSTNTNTLFCTGTLFYKSKHPLQPEKPSARTCKNRILHSLYGNHKYQIQVLHPTPSKCSFLPANRIQQPYTSTDPTGPTPPHCNWSHRFHRWTLTRSPWQPAVSSDLIPNRMKDEISKRESVQGVFCEGQVCFNSRWLKIYGTSKIPGQHFGDPYFSPPIWATSQSLPLMALFTCAQASIVADPRAIRPKRTGWENTRRARKKETWIIQNDSKMCS